MKIVGIAACPAGLAHTPMAAKALEKAGAKLGYDLKMEQQGSMGQVNKITEEEAKEAAFVIVASDQKILGMCSSNTKIKKQFNLAESNCIHKTIVSSVYSHYNIKYEKRGKTNEKVFKRC